MYGKETLLQRNFELTNTARTSLEPLVIFAPCRAVGTGEPAFSMNYGRLQASI
jgi:hypothetical protein